jgi:hypothetical protein
MRDVRTIVAALGCGLILGACSYIVLPPEEMTSAPTESRGWSAIATGIEPAGGSQVKVDLTIRNDTGDWSSMEAAEDRPAVLTTSDGQATDCTTVQIGTGGHRLPPGFQMRGYVGGTKADPVTELIGVECPVEEIGPGSRLAIDYRYANGDYNYYDPEANTATGRLEVDLDTPATDLTYPIAEAVDGLIQPADTPLTAINDVELALVDRERTETGLRLTWRTTNPGEYPSSVHIGIPPVIGDDGILYGFYQSPDIATVPITPAAGEVSWTTEVDVPSEVSGLVIPLSVESKKQRLFVHYALELGGS